MNFGLRHARVVEWFLLSWCHGMILTAPYQQFYGMMGRGEVILHLE